METVQQQRRSRFQEVPATVDPVSLCAAAVIATRVAALLWHAGYENVSSKLVQALREAIETDLSDASEREVCWDSGMVLHAA